MSYGAQAPTVGISVTAASKSLAYPVGFTNCRVTNTSSSVTVFVAFGVGAATAVIPTADNATGTNVYCVSPNATVHIDVPPGANYVAAIGSAAGPTLTYFTPGHEA